MKTKHIIAAITFSMVGWLAASQINSVQAKYEQDITDYQAVLQGDTIPLQARMEKARPTVEMVKLAKAVADFRAKEAKAEEITSHRDTRSSAERATADRIISTALNFLGVPYRFGQSSPSGFDCSGFTSYVYKQQNIQLTRSSREQFHEGAPVADVTDLRKGDLVFFGGSRGGAYSVGHVGIVTEVDPDTRSFKFIHASRSSGIKVDDSKQAYFSRRYVGARRILQ